MGGCGCSGLVLWVSMGGEVCECGGEVGVLRIGRC